MQFLVRLYVLIISTFQDKDWYSTENIKSNISRRFIPNEIMYVVLFILIQTWSGRQLYDYVVINPLGHLWLASHIWNIGNSVDPDQMPHNEASDQDLHCLLTGISIYNMLNKRKIHQLLLKWQMNSSN